MKKSILLAMFGGVALFSVAGASLADDVLSTTTTTPSTTMSTTTPTTTSTTTPSTSTSTTTIATPPTCSVAQQSSQQLVCGCSNGGDLQFTYWHGKVSLQCS